MFDRLEENFNAERQFTSDASHELRTPVSVDIEPMPVFRSPSQWADAFLMIAMLVSSRAGAERRAYVICLARVLRIDRGAKFT